jgi:hypothetical protein
MTKKIGTRKKSTTKIPAKKQTSRRVPVLSCLEDAPKELVATYKGTEHMATLNPEGTITVNGKTFNSPSRAGKEVTGREVDGWTFWSYVKQDGGIEKIDGLRNRTA